MSEHFDGPTLTINLSAIVANWSALRDRHQGRECAAVVKAEAYGLGMRAIAKALASAGCETFFVATLDEGIALRSTLPEKRIAVFHGVGPGEELAFVNHKLIPALNSPFQIERWKSIAKERRDAVSILHLDTAMGRLGLTQQEWKNLDEETVKDCRVSLLMSHLSTASDAAAPSNEAQRALFEAAAQRFPAIPRSLANSGGILLGDAWHYDLARPGCALYGINPAPGLPCAVEPVATLCAPILQIRRIDAEQPIGYAGTHIAAAGTRLATVALGYADGILRSLSNVSFGYIGEQAVPLVGRVTMDMLSFDVSAVPEGLLHEGTRISLINNRQTVNDVAEQAGTIGYEIFSRLGNRVQRIYVGSEIA